MTHEDILKKVRADQAITEYLNKGLMKGDIAINVARQHWFQSNALESVIKRHTPEHSIRGYRCKIDDELYPCAEIQAIEKELG
jgi:hypothetical protein